MSDIVINVEGKAYDLDDFELGDLEWLEDFIGGSLNDPAAMNSIKAAIGFVYLVKHHDDPDFTVEQARKVKLAAIEAPEEPKPAAKRPPKRAAR